MKTGIAIALSISLLAAIANYAAREAAERPSISPTELTIKSSRKLPEVETNGI